MIKEKSEIETPMYFEPEPNWRSMYEEQKKIAEYGKCRYEFNEDFIRAIQNIFYYNDDLALAIQRHFDDIAVDFIGG